MRRAGFLTGCEHHGEHVAVPCLRGAGDAEDATARHDEAMFVDAVTDRLRAGAERHDLCSRDEAMVPRGMGRDLVVEGAQHRVSRTAALLPVTTRAPARFS